MLEIIIIIVVVAAITAAVIAGGAALAIWASSQLRDTSVKTFAVDGRFLCEANCIINVSYEFKELKDERSGRCHIVAGSDSSLPEEEGLLLSIGFSDDIP